MYKLINERNIHVMKIVANVMRLILSIMKMKKW